MKISNKRILEYHCSSLSKKYNIAYYLDTLYLEFLGYLSVLNGDESEIAMDLKYHEIMAELKYLNVF